MGLYYSILSGQIKGTAEHLMYGVVLEQYYQIDAVTVGNHIR